MMLEQGKFYEATYPRGNEFIFQVLQYGDPGWVFARIFSEGFPEGRDGWLNLNHFTHIHQASDPRQSS